MAHQNSPLWDIPTRVCHWLFVVVFGFSWWSAEYDHMDWHTWSGYTLLALIFFRIIWGFVGSESARFSHFLRGPTAVWTYMRQLFKRRSDPSRGHNPMGGWSVVVLLGAMLIQVTLGLFAEDVDGLASGPLSYNVSYDTARWAAETHEDFINVLLFLAGLHIGFIFFYLLYKKDNLITPMLTGSKTGVDSAGLRQAPLWLAILVLTGVVAFVWWLVT